MHAGGYLNFYIVRMAINLYRSRNSKFQRDFRHNELREEIADQQLEAADEPYDQRPDAIFNRALEVMDSWAKAGAYPYDKQLFLLWLELGNKKLIERHTKIPWRSISYTINNCKQRLKHELGSDYYLAFGHYDFCEMQAADLPDLPRILVGGGADHRSLQPALDACHTGRPIGCRVDGADY